MNLTTYLLRDEREYVISRIKKPIMKALIILSDRIPEPTKENCVHPNSHILLDIWDEFFSRETNSTRKPLFEAIRRIMVSEYETDPYYRERMDWFLKQIIKSDWKIEREPQSFWG